MSAKASPSEPNPVTFDLTDDLQGSTKEKEKETMEEKQASNSAQSRAANRMEALCKMLAAFMVLTAFIVHLVRILNNGSDTCRLMFNDGWWRGDMWQPYGCMMHNYIPSEVRTCLQNNPVAFVGDSRTREVYFELIRTLSSDVNTGGKKHGNLHFQEGNLSVSFFWQPEVNESMRKLYDKWIKSILEFAANFIWLESYFLCSSSKGRPQLIITGISTWTIRYQGLEEASVYERNLSIIKESIEVLSRINDEPKVKSLAALKPSFPSSPVVVWVAQAPTVPSKLYQARKSITNKKIEFFNTIADKVFHNSSVRVLRSVPLVAKGRPEASPDGLHYESPVSDVELDFLMNFYCNRYMQVSDASCCVDAPRITQLQYNTIAVFVTCIVLFVLMFVCRRLWPPEHDELAGVEATTPGGHPSSSLRWVYSKSMYPVMRSMAKFGVIMFYFYLCDRSNLFFKEQKQYSDTVFGVTMLGFLALGAYTWTSTEDVSLLSRDQTNEWRGWMQLVILLYHYIGASHTLPIYVFIRLLVASYLFMSGYGHFSFFWNKGEYSLYRFCQVMTRMNIFTVVLCLVMGRPYQFYYFVPLVSFWFVVVYVTMAVLPRVTAASVRDDPKQYVFIWLKFFVLFGVIYVLWSSPLLFDWVFSQWAVKQLFIDVNDSVREWRFRSWLDRYIVLYGMIFAFAYNTARQLRVLDDSIKKRLFSSHSTVIIVMSALAVAVYAIQALTCSSKPSCNATHAVASCVPITAYILLRNTPIYMRSRFSRFYSWVGTMSLELFIGQYHILLAQDTKGILVLIPGLPLLNVIITSFIFVCVCHEVHNVSVTLAKELISNNITIMIRRLVIFIIMLIIIWWHKTHHPLKPRMT